MRLRYLSPALALYLYRAEQQVKSRGKQWNASKSRILMPRKVVNAKYDAAVQKPNIGECEGRSLFCLKKYLIQLHTDSVPWGMILESSEAQQ